MNYEPSEKKEHYMEEFEEPSSVPSKPENHLVRMPKTISTAINNITKEMQMLGKDGKNEFQKYNYASIDKFLSTVNPLAGHFGLILTQDEETCKIITDTQGRPWLILCIVLFFRTKMETLGNTHQEELSIVR